MFLFSFLVLLLIQFSISVAQLNNYIKLICAHNDFSYWLITLKNETKIKFNNHSTIKFYKNFSINIYKENNLNIFEISKHVNIKNNEYLNISYVYQLIREPNCDCIHICDFTLTYENKSLFLVYY